MCLELSWAVWAVWGCLGTRRHHLRVEGLDCLELSGAVWVCLGLFSGDQGHPDASAVQTLDGLRRMRNGSQDLLHDIITLDGLRRMRN